MSYKSHIKHAYHSYDFKNDLKFNMDLHTLTARINKELIKINNNSFPLNLSIKYSSEMENTNQVFINSVDDIVYTYLPYGWMFNYQLYLSHDYINNTYTLIDSNYIYHLFTYNGIEYIDTLGSGLTLKFNQPYMSLVDLNGNITNFDIYGMVVNKKYKLNTSPVTYKTITYYYDSDNRYKLVKLKDSINNELRFTYDINYIQIDLYNSELIKSIRLIISNNKLSNINDNNIASSFSYYENYKLKSVQTLSSVKMELSYISDNDINIKYKSDSIILKDYTIHRFEDESVILENLNEEDYNYIIYSYDSEGSLINTYDGLLRGVYKGNIKVNSNILNHKINDNILLNKVYYSNTFSPYSFSFGINQVNTYEMHNLNINNLVLDQLYVLDIYAYVNSVDLDNTSYAKISLISGSNLLSSTYFSLKSTEYKVINLSFKNISNTNELYIKLDLYSSENQNTLIIEDIDIYKVTSETILCTNINNNSNFRYTYNNQTYYGFTERVDISYTLDNTGLSYNLENIKMTYLDLYYTLLSYSNDNTLYKLYYNNLEEVISDINELEINANPIEDVKYYIINQNYSFNNEITTNLVEVKFNNSLREKIEVSNKRIINDIEYINTEYYSINNIITKEKDELDNYTKYTLSSLNEVVNKESYHIDNNIKYIDDYKLSAYSNGLKIRDMYYYGRNDIYDTNVSIDEYEYSSGLNNLIRESNYDVLTNLANINKSYNYDLNNRLISIINNEDSNYKHNISYNISYPERIKTRVAIKNDNLINKYEYNNIHGHDEETNQDFILDTIKYTYNDTSYIQYKSIKTIYNPTSYNSKRVIVTFNTNTIDNIIFIYNYDLYGFLVEIKKIENNVTGLLKEYYYGNILVNASEIDDIYSDSLFKSKTSVLLKEVDYTFSPNRVTIYSYNNYCNLISYYNSLYSYNACYDNYNRLNNISYGISIDGIDRAFRESYTYLLDKDLILSNNIRFERENFNNIYILTSTNYLYNKLNEYTLNINNNILKESYSYKDFYIESHDEEISGKTNLISNYKLNYNDDIIVNQDIDYSSNRLNISEISDNINNTIIRYKYNSLNELVEEDLVNNKKIVYNYEVGNITSKVYYRYNNTSNTYDECKTYTYTYTNNKLNSYTISENDDTTIYTYEYSDLLCIEKLNNNVYKKYVYDKLNRLESVLDSNDNTIVTFTYNKYDNKRLTKTNLNYEHHYYYNQFDKLVLEKITNLNNNDIYYLNYIYDNSFNNKLISFVLEKNNNYIDTYYYKYDSLGNIIGLLDNYGNNVVQYKYDSYGNIIEIIDDTQINLSNINPFRYKEYYYDTETNYYYLINRYYNPISLRFITMDDIDYISDDNSNGYNLYSYCNNNPIMYSDPEGKFALSAIIIGVAISLAATCLKDYLNDGRIFNGDVSAFEYIGSGVTGLLGGIAGQSGNMLIRIAGSVGSEIVGGLISENVNYSWSSFKNNVITGLTVAGISEGISIIGEKITKSVYLYEYSSVSKAGKKQLTKFFKTNGMYNVTNESAKKLLDSASNYISCFDALKDTTANFYSFLVGVFGNLFEW